MVRRDKLSVAAMTASGLISASVLLDLPMWLIVCLRAAAIGIIGGLIVVAWHWQQRREVESSV